LHGYEASRWLWPLGWLVRKAFFGRVPFPVMHVDTGK
jgi:hypothetical protein